MPPQLSRPSIKDVSESDEERRLEERKQGVVEGGIALIAPGYLLNTLVLIASKE